MQQVLLKIPTNTAISIAGMDIPLFGFGLLLGLWILLCAIWTLMHLRSHPVDGDLRSQLVFEVAVAAIIVQMPRLTPELNIFGYGAAMVCGFLVASWLAAQRAESEGIDPAVMWDIGMVVLFSGVVGARLFYIIKNPGQFFNGKRTFLETLFELVNLTNGGLVLYGGVLLGIAAYAYYCYRLKLSALRIADIVIPSIFVGEMFGRIGCFLNGCCYGDQTALPWAVQFPKDSLPYKVELANGLINAQATCSLPLHPTQLYSSLAAAALATITWYYFPRRTRHGDVLLLGWFLYPISRFCLEILRDDTPGELGTSLTIAQLVSIGMLLAAGIFWLFQSRQKPLNKTNPQSLSKGS